MKFSFTYSSLGLLLLASPFCHALDKVTTREYLYEVKTENYFPGYTPKLLENSDSLGELKQKLKVSLRPTAEIDAYFKDSMEHFARTQVEVNQQKTALRDFAIHLPAVRTPSEFQPPAVSPSEKRIPLELNFSKFKECALAALPVLKAMAKIEIDDKLPLDKKSDQLRSFEGMLAEARADGQIVAVSGMSCGAYLGRYSVPRALNTVEEIKRLLALTSRGNEDLPQLLNVLAASEHLEAHRSFQGLFRHFWKRLAAYAILRNPNLPLPSLQTLSEGLKKTVDVPIENVAQSGQAVAVLHLIPEDIDEQTRQGLEFARSLGQVK
jgi:hypothetical protein